MGEAKRKRTTLRGPKTPPDSPQRMADLEAAVREYQAEVVEPLINPMALRLREALVDAIQECEDYEGKENPDFERQLFDRALFMAIGNVLAGLAVQSFPKRERSNGIEQMMLIIEASAFAYCEEARNLVIKEADNGE